MNGKKYPPLCIVLALLLTSCIQIKTTGTSGRVFKNQSLSSPLVGLSDEFYPGGKPQTIDGVVKSLPAEQVAHIRKDLSAKLTLLKQAHLALHKYLEAEMGVALPASIPIDLEIERVAEQTEEIRSDNTIYIDLGVLQAFFKTAIVDLSRSSELGHRNPPAAGDENQIVQNFLEFKQDLRKTKGRTIIGDAFHDDDDWFTLVDMSTEMNKATSQYYGVLLFTLAHEMGHYALGHLKEKCDSSNCQRFGERELEADRYAAAMMSALVPQMPALLDFDFDGIRERLRGFEPFFKIGYKMARFSSISSCACPYPSPEKRMELAQAEYEQATKRLYADGWVRVSLQPAQPRTSDSVHERH